MSNLVEVGLNPSRNQARHGQLTGYWSGPKPTSLKQGLATYLPTGWAGGERVRFVCMSDTHSLTPHIRFDIPYGDVFIHAGDFTRCGREEEVVDFNKWIGQLPHKHKLVIAGNHELSFDRTFTHPLGSSPGDRATHTGTSLIDQIPTLGIPKDNIAEAVKTTNIKNCLTNCTYLEDQEIKLYEACLSKWDQIPTDTDILVTHTPPVGHGDLCCSGIRAGCVELLTTVQHRVRPKYHVFGHIHEGCVELLTTVQHRVRAKYHVFGHIHEGRTDLICAAPVLEQAVLSSWPLFSIESGPSTMCLGTSMKPIGGYGISTDGKIIYINASTCDLNYLPTNPAIVFDVTLPLGCTKE
uniref:Calcineurin-like phosphoesterase domain-containing protein n=1 Tax=Timema tahoe TaxID=61484 RepID=A0A7R9FMK7_9NEOP|nr:unnamed protein product [Timema tahoe]